MVFLCPFLGIACLFDYESRRIPNIIQFHIFSIGLLFSFWSAKLMGIVHYALTAAIVMLILFPVFRLGMIGAGDVKLLCLSAGFFIGVSVIWFIFYSFLLSGVVSMIHLFVKRTMKNRIGYLGGYVKSIKTKGAHIYIDSREEKIKNSIAMSGPILLSAMLHWGGLF